jgi:hypothetical protein
VEGALLATQPEELSRAAGNPARAACSEACQCANAARITPVTVRMGPPCVGRMWCELNPRSRRWNADETPLDSTSCGSPIESLEVGTDSIASGLIQLLIQPSTKSPYGAPTLPLHLSSHRCPLSNGYDAFEGRYRC